MIERFFVTYLLKGILILLVSDLMSGKKYETGKIEGREKYTGEFSMELNTKSITNISIFSLEVGIIPTMKEENRFN